MRRIIGSTLFLLASTGWACAALGPLEAAAILTETKAANAKCGFLNRAEADNLNLFTARAEVAAVGVESADSAGAQLQQARARGGQTACNADAKARVREIYDAANEAMQAVNRETEPAQGPVNILPKPKAAGPLQPAPRPIQHQAPAPQPLIQPQPQPQVLVPAPQPVPVQPQVSYNFAAQQPPIPQPQPQPQYVYAEPVPQPEPQYVYAASPAPEPVPQYAYAAPQPDYVQTAPQYAAPLPQPILNQRFLARFSVVLERPEPQLVVYQTPAAVYAPAPVYAPVSDVTPAGLDHYARRASAYYVEMRCQHLNPQQARQFWQSIATEHAAMLERESPGAIEAALAQARAQADQMACSSQSAAFVQNAFQGW